VPAASIFQRRSLFGVTPPVHDTWGLRLLVQSTAEAANYVVVYEANRLHERIADLGANESEAAPDQVLA